VALLTQAAMDGNDGGWAVLYGVGAAPLSASSMNLAVDEDQIKDEERSHTSEQVGYLAFEEALVYPVVSVVAGFSGSPLSGVAPLTVTFTNDSTGATSYEWDFGDSATSTLDSPTHVYTATGVYTVSLTATGPSGSDTLTRTSYVNVSSGTGGYTTTTRVITYTYDSLSRLISATYSTGEQFGYGYDEVGNRTVMTTTQDVVGATGVTTYTYDAANRLTSVGGVSYTWDARGNLVSDGTFTYTYDAVGRMVEAEGVTLTLVYTYNASGLRVAQSVDGDVTAFAWDWASGLPEMLSNGESLYLVGHETLGQWDGAAWVFYLPDALGSIRHETDGMGDVTDSREWTPFGVEVGTAQEGLGYTGEWQDIYTNHLGMLYLRARWYQPHTGRFFSPDPIIPDFRNPQSIHRYAYVLGDPVNHNDPTGLLRFSAPPVVGFYRTFGFGPTVAAHAMCDAICIPSTPESPGQPEGCDYRGTRGLHNGLDFSTPDGTPVYWTGDVEGVVDSTGEIHPDATKNVVVRADGYLVVFGHLLNWTMVQKDQTVTAGDQLGTTGEGHLHFGVKTDTEHHNPPYFFDAWVSSIVAVMQPYIEGENPLSMRSFTREGECGKYYWDEDPDMTGIEECYDPPLECWWQEWYGRLPPQ
jgi:RHS repeat-associated protein